MADDLSLTSALALRLRTITALARQGLDDDHRFAEARAAYQKIKETLPPEKITELWAAARAAYKNGNESSPAYWLKVFGNEADRRYQASYRARPKAKKRKAAYMTAYFARPEVKARRATYMREWRAARTRNGASGDKT